MKLTAVIVDDEAKGRRTLKAMIEEYCTSVEVVDTADDVLSGVKAISTHQPDVVFLDIHMPNYSGFKLIEYFDNPEFQIIFTTAYEEYAMQAYKAKALAYLVKPIDIDELIEAVGRVQQIKENDPEQALPTPNDKATDNEKRFVMPTQGALLYMLEDEIISIESQGRYSKIYLKEGKEVITTKSLRDCEATFVNTLLLRIHKSWIINLAYIKKYAKGRDAHVIMETKQRIDVGQIYKDQLTQLTSIFEK